MSGWFHALDVMDNIVIFVLFVVLPLLLIACEINDAIEEEKIRERHLRYKLQKEAEKESKREEEEEKNKLYAIKKCNLNKGDFYEN